MGVSFYFTEASCLTEMALMMACWKTNEFSDHACAKEITTFFECAAKAEVIAFYFSPIFYKVTLFHIY